jgi:predicted dehydrogenase
MSTNETNEPVRLGIVGCGAILPAYVQGLRIYPQVRIEACADLDVARARLRADEFGIPRALAVEDLLRDPAVDLVVNLTVPKAHAAVNRAALEAGKHVYVEKPLALDPEAAADLLALGTARGLRLGCAPDTFLGGGIQTARRLIDEGAIGRPVAATACFANHGHEHWHPNPQFYYERGGGPMFDMGPYYLTALLEFLGPCASVSGTVGRASDTRTIESQPRAGETIPVETPTHYAGTLEFHGGAIASVFMSFDIWGHHQPLLEVHGTEGSLEVPDPNRFDGVVRIKRGRAAEWEPVESTHRTDIGRGSGVADMACALREGRPHRASGERAAHVVEIMTAFETSARERRHVGLSTAPARPAALAPGLPPGRLD